ncbi:lysine--tRNA ligase [Halococcus salifodinae]|uniref:Lysine--tRNA ligase n=1 Tax=Halococcus salifodinae DSM 8989 TaxID=1227456 RepID=M0NAC8_9EURY|nr:lysine--tRNA ligase [Halococcus salifodinae]EMA54932.1 lysyl-tRNA ligase [Halococcus salifodinae DSM 8989]
MTDERSTGSETPDDAVDDPYVLSGSQPHDFWAESVAKRIIERNPDDPIVIKGGISPSGVPHLGNMNEIARGYFVAEALRDRGRTVRQIFTADDRDPLRKVPRKLADLDGNVVGLDEVDAGALGRNLGKPYTAIPDPFGCCDSYGAHFSNLIERSAELLDIPVETVSNTERYESGAFDDVIHQLLEHREQARSVLAKYQDKVDDDYVPFRPICAECGHVTETDAVQSVDLDAETVEYVCTDVEAGDRIIEGCGHEGTATFREGKLPWRFEWPAQWQVLDVDFEPFGKDHAEGSWPSGADIARNVLGDTPPVPMAYEWFTLDGEPFSSSTGHVIMVQDALEFLEPEVLRYFFTKDPSRARDFSIERADQLVDEFDEFERTYFGEFASGHKMEGEAEAAYPLLVESTAEQPIRLPYTFAAVLGMTDDIELREKMARRQDHIPESAPKRSVEEALGRVEYARTWAERVDNAYNYRLAADLPTTEFDATTAAALDDLADFVEAGHDGEAIQSHIFETARRHDLDPGDLFAAGYRLFFDTDQGPQLGTFLADLDRAFVVRRLRREA